MAELYWHCLQCGSHEVVEPTGGEEEYTIGDHEPCIDCGDGTCHVLTIQESACYEQGLSLGMTVEEAWKRVIETRKGKQ